VLEATDTSRAFYETLGFVRVGAVAKYGKKEEVLCKDGTTTTVESQGYRHWAPADLSRDLIPERGPPSCMMARRIEGLTKTATNTKDSCKIPNLYADCPCECGSHSWPFLGSFGEELDRYFVKEKPTILPLCNATKASSAAAQNNNRSTTASGGTKRGSSSVITPTLTEKVLKYTRSSNGRRITPSCRALCNFEMQQQQLQLRQHSVPSSLSESTMVTTNNVSSVTRKNRTNSNNLTNALRQSSQPNLLNNNKNDIHNTSNHLGKQLIQPSRRRGTTFNSLLKQDIANMYRHPKTIYYYNKVVTPKRKQLYIVNPDPTNAIEQDNNNNNKARTMYKSKYYFVLNYDPKKQKMRLIPLHQSGKFSKGSRMGKPKWKARVSVKRESYKDDWTWWQSMDVICDDPCEEWEIAQSYMVTKCKSVASESWDIL